MDKKLQEQFYFILSELKKMSESFGGVASSAKELVDVVLDVQKQLNDKLTAPETEGTTGQVLQKAADGGIDWVTPSAGTTPDSEMSDESTNAVQNKVIKTYVDDAVAALDAQKANKDGYYEQLVSGSAKNLEAPITVSDTFLTRPTGGTDTEAADGVAQITEVKGNSVKYNQLVASDATSVTVTSGHKYYSMIGGTAAVGTSTGSAISVTGGTDYIFDLTAMEIDGLTTTAAVEAWLAENIGVMAYYPYNAGTVINNCMEGIEAPGYNLLDPATGKAQIIGEYSDLYGDYYGIVGTHGALTFTDAYGNESTITPDSDGKFELTVPGELSVASAGDDCAVFLWWDGTKKEYEGYELNHGYLDVKHIYGKLNGAGDYVRVWPMGMPGSEYLFDSLKNDNGAVVAEKKYVGLDLGNLSWTYKTTGSGTGSGAYPYFFATYSAIKTQTNPICGKYTLIDKSSADFGTGPDKVISGRGITAENSINIRDTAYTDSTVFRSAVSGTIAYTELATPLRYTNLVYQGSSYYADGTPVVLPVNYKVNNWSIESIIPKNTTSALVTAPPVLTCKYSLGAVDLLNTHTDEISNLYDVKADKEGTYPDIISGNLIDVNGTGTDQEFTRRQTGGGEAITGNSNGVIQSIKGNTLKWNQLLTRNAASTNVLGVTVTWNESNMINMSGSASYPGGRTTWLSQTTKPINIVNEHKYIIYAPTNADITWFLTSISNTSNWITPTPNAIFTAKKNISDALLGVNINTTNEISASGYVLLTDLTEMFGSGNEPTTVAEFEALYNESYYAYNAGTLLPLTGEGLQTVGFNQYDNNSGKVSVIKGKTYYVGGTYTALAYSDGTAITVSSNTFTADRTDEVTVTGGNATDTIINISDAARNGQYEPYWTSTLNLPITTATGKLNGEGESVVVSPDGMNRVGSVYDEIIVENGVAVGEIRRIGIRAYQSGDESDASVLTDGTNTAYALSSPLTYIFDTPFPVSYRVDGDGTETLLPQGVDTNGVPKTSPLSATIFYSKDYVQTINDMPKDFDTTASIDALATALGTALGTALDGTFTITRGDYDATNKKYAWTVTFTPNE